MSILAKLALLAIVFALGAAGGIKWHAGQDAIKEVARQENIRATERMRRQNTNTAATGHEADKVVIQKEFVPIREEVTRVQIEYRDRACLADDGVQLLNRAIGTTGHSGQPGDTVPSPAAAP